MKSISVVAAIIHRDGRILATQRGYGEFAGGWEFPGGKIDPGESAEYAIVREIQEELAVTIAVGSPLITIDYDYPTFHLHMQCFWAQVQEGEFHLLEHSDARWLDANSIESVAWLPADLEAIDAIRRSGMLVGGD